MVAQISLGNTSFWQQEIGDLISDLYKYVGLMFYSTIQTSEEKIVGSKSLNKNPKLIPKKGSDCKIMTLWYIHN